MFRSYAIAMATFLLASAFAMRHAEASFELLNNYLEKVVDSDEVDANMRAAFKWLVKSTGAKPGWRISSPKDKFALDELKQFTSLEQVIEDTKCDRIANGIMRDIEEAIGLYKLLGDGQVKRRVDKVVLGIFTDHAKKCQEVYTATYKTKEHHLDEQVKELVENLATVIVEADIRRTETQNDPDSLFEPNNLLDRYIKNSLAIRDFAREDSLFKALKANAKNDPDFKYARILPDGQTGEALVYADEIRKLIKKYLIKPCQEYIAEFEADLFGPAKFELPVNTIADNPDRDFYRGWANSMICQALTGREELVVYGVIQYIITKPVIS